MKYIYELKCSECGVRGQIGSIELVVERYAMYVDANKEIKYDSYPVSIHSEVEGIICSHCDYDFGTDLEKIKHLIVKVE